MTVFLFIENSADTNTLCKKLLSEEIEYAKILASAAELYDDPIARTNNTEWDLSIIFKNLSDLSAICGILVNEVCMKRNLIIILPITLANKIDLHIFPLTSKHNLRFLLRYCKIFSSFLHFKYCTSINSFEEYKLVRKEK